MSDQAEQDRALIDWMRTARRPLYTALEGAIDDLRSVGVAATAAGHRRQDLRDWLDDRAGRLLPVSVPWGVGRVLSEARRAEVARALVEPLGYAIVPLRPLTAEERLQRLEYRVATELGEAGRRLVEENRR